MIVVFGAIFVLVAILTGFGMAGGSVHALIHPSEFVTIGGAALGSMIIMSPKRVLIDLFRGILQVLKGTPYNKRMYLEFFGLIYALARLTRRDGVLALESHVTDPHKSPLFQKYPRFAKDHHATQFLCTAMASLMENNADPDKLGGWFEEEIKVREREHHAAIGVLAKTADALPGFGIVAAVLGIVITMGAISGPVSEIGNKVGAALVGTFLGILLSYGFFAPLAARMEFLGEAETHFFRTVSAAVVVMARGENPREVITQACRGVATDCRPGPAELKDVFSQSEAA